MRQIRLASLASFSIEVSHNLKKMECDFRTVKNINILEKKRKPATERADAGFQFGVICSVFIDAKKGTIYGPQQKQNKTQFS